MIVTLKPPAPEARPPQRIPLICPGDALVIDIARRAAEQGNRLVHNGHHVYLTPMRRPGEFPVGAAAK
jgi:hypothetical protein